QGARNRGSQRPLALPGGGRARPLPDVVARGPHERERVSPCENVDVLEASDLGRRTMRGAHMSVARYCLVALLTGCNGVARAPAPFAAPLHAYHEGTRLAVVGDLQRTAPLLEFWREQNDVERAGVVAAIAN